jgi:hypothetical protein
VATDDELLEPRRQPASDRRQRRRRVARDRDEHLHGRLADERAEPGEHLVEERAEGEDVAPRVEVHPHGLLRAHVGRRPHHAPFLRRVGRRVVELERLARRGLARLEELREAEIEDFDLAVLVQHDVLGLEIAVDDPLLVRLGQRARDGPRDAQRLGDAEPAARHLRLQRGPLDELHRDVDAAVDLADVVDGGDVGVSHRRGGPRLAEEPATPVVTLHRFVGEDLEGDVATEALVERAVHDPHAAHAEDGEKLEMTQRLPDEARARLRGDLAHRGRVYLSAGALGPSRSAGPASPASFRWPRAV